MNLSDFDLRQLADRDLRQLSATEKDRLLGRLLGDLIEARERLKANSQNSSRPPSSDLPWSGVVREEEEEVIEAEQEPEPPQGNGEEDEEAVPPVSQPAVAAKSKPGRRVGAVGHSRSLTLPVTATVLHVPEHCALCGTSANGDRFVARTGRYVLDLEITRGQGLLGLQVSHQKHL